MNERVSLITGGSSGLGFALARRLARRGDRLILLARGEERLQEAARVLQAEGAQVRVLCADVASEQDMLRVADDLRRSGETIDFLVSNAGAVRPAALRDRHDLAELRDEVEINLWGGILTTQVLLPFLAPRARLLYVSSGLGLVGLAGYGAYCATKAGLLRFGEAMRRELKAWGMTVHVACPGDVDTPQYRREWAQMPPWMAAKAALSVPRDHPQSADRVAQRILRGCRGRRLLLTPDRGVSLLAWAQKLLPGWSQDLLLDRMAPLHRPQDTAAALRSQGGSR